MDRTNGNEHPELALFLREVKELVARVVEERSPFECLTIPEAARELRIGVSTLYRLIERKQLRTCKVAGCTRIRRTELRKYLDRVTRK
jgi:excisionase family DNA binding protein